MGELVAKLDICARAAGLGLSCAALAPFAHAGAIDNPHFRIMGAAIVWGADTDDAAPIVSDFVINTSAAIAGDADLIAGNVKPVIIGTLIPTDDAWSTQSAMTPLTITNTPLGTNFSTDRNGDRETTDTDAFGAFRIQANSDVLKTGAWYASSFYVASNNPFHISAIATRSPTTTVAQFNLMTLRLTTTTSGTAGALSFGSAAQNPHSANATTSGSRALGRRLNTMLTRFDVFRGNRRTARVPGTITQQSVRFNLDYRIAGGNYDLSRGLIDSSAEVVYTVYIP